MWVIAAVVLGLAAGTAGANPATPQTSTPVSSEYALRAYAQGRLLEARGDYREALGEYVRALALDPNAVPVARRVAELVGRMGDPESALEYANKALAIDSTDARTLWIKGTSLLASNRPAEALPPLEKAVRYDSTHVEYLQALARAAEAVDRVDVVERAYSRAVELDPDDGESWFQLAAAQARLGHFAAADSSLAQATELAPLRPGQLFLQGWIAENLGHIDEAIDRYKHHLQVHPDDQAGRRRLVNLLGRQHRWAEALPEAERVSRANPNDWETLMVEAEIAMRAGKIAEAKPLIDRLEKLSDSDVDRCGALCALLVSANRNTDAIRVADEWAARHVGDPAGLYLAARTRGAAGKREEAIPLARSAVDAAPDSLRPRLLLARLCADTQRWSEAESTLKVVIKQRPKNVGLILELATVYEEKGDSQKAESAARDALKLEPDNARALNFLGYLMADHNRSLDEAEHLIRRALEQDPDNGAYVDSLGWLFYRLGRLQDARIELERAVELTDGDSVVREHLGDLYRDLKLMDQARAQYRMSLDRDSSNSRVRDKLAKLR